VQLLPGVGAGKPEGGHRGKSQLERGGVGCKFNTYRGGEHYFFHSFSQTGKLVEDLAY